MEQTSTRRKKSVSLTSDEKKAFSKYVESFDTKMDCIERLKISRPTLDRLLFKGSGKPETIQLIREELSAIA